MHECTCENASVRMYDCVQRAHTNNKKEMSLTFDL